MINNQEIGIITEQGDLGLGFDPITEEEENKIKKKKQSDEDEEVS